jgi:hypothetical protein
LYVDVHGGEEKNSGLLWGVWSKAGLKAVCGECGEVFERAGGKTTVEMREGVYKVMRAKYGG